MQYITPMQQTLLSIPDWLTETPRRIERRNWAMITFQRLLLLPFILLGFAAVFAMLGIAAWLAFGTDRQAIVEKTWVTQQTKTQWIDHVSYRCEVDHKIVRDETTVSSDEFDELTQAAKEANTPTIRVRTIGIPPLMYEHALESGDRGWAIASGVWAFGAVLAGLGRAAYFFAFQLPRRQRNLYLLGEIAPGEIVEKVMAMNGKLLSFSLRYKFTPPDGQTRANSLSINRTPWDKATVGQSVYVLYDANEPDTSTIYEFGDFIAQKPGE